MDGVTHAQVDAGEVELHVALAGPEAGPLVVLLHGFPDFWYGWRHQIEALAAQGFRVAAPDMRGYGLSDKPEGIAAYTLDALSGDVEGLIRALGRERADVVGHDWGGMTAWHVASTRPDCVRRLAVLNAPHPRRFARALATLGQARKSWYMAAFQLPVVPELVLAARDYEVPRGLLGAFGARGEDLERHVGALARPGVLTAAVNYYRAMRLGGPLADRVIAPTRVIWGDRDPFLGAEMADPGSRVPDREVCLVARARHWPHWDAPDEVNRLLVEFLTGGGAA
jgi:pimeloyl-ACP methyl ester carboxylesterase